jgi:LemA protein
MSMIVLPIIAGLVLLAFVAWVIGIFNGLVRLRNAVKNAWAQIDVQLKRRHDLIPNLVETAKGYMEHERETLESVVKARNQAAEGSKQSADASTQSTLESGLSGALRNFMVVVERYPDLKADTLFANLQEELSSTENRIGFARQAYNDAVMMMNNKVEMFPGNIVAGMFNFNKESFFEIEVEAEREVPKVSFS